MKLRALEPPIRGDRNLTSPSEPVEEGPLRSNRQGTRPVSHGLHQVAYPLIVCTDLQTEGPLADSGEADLERQDFGDLLLPPETVYPGSRNHYGVESLGVEFPQPSIQVPPERHHGQVGPKMQELGLPPQTARADPGAGGQSIQFLSPARDEDVGRVFSLENSGNAEARGDLGRDVLHAVDRHVHLTIQQGLLDLLDEEPFAPHVRQGDVGEHIAAGLDLHQHRRKLRVPAPELARDPLRLRDSERAPPSPNAQFTVHGSPFTMTDDRSPMT